eukprot:1661703-Lingulodinium_polyedra.AAC.1
MQSICQRMRRTKFAYCARWALKSAASPLMLALCSAPRSNCAAEDAAEVAVRTHGPTAGDPEVAG